MIMGHGMPMPISIGRGTILLMSMDTLDMITSAKVDMLKQKKLFNHY